MCWEGQNNKTSIWLWEGGPDFGSNLELDERDKAERYFEKPWIRVRDKGLCAAHNLQKNVFIYIYVLEKRGKFNPRVRLWISWIFPDLGDIPPICEKTHCRAISIIISPVWSFLCSASYICKPPQSINTASQISFHHHLWGYNLL